MSFLIPDINECVSSPCYNNGSCINTQGSYNCECVEGWQDENCHKGTRWFPFYSFMNSNSVRYKWYIVINCRKNMHTK